MVWSHAAWKIMALIGCYDRDLSVNNCQPLRGTLDRHHFVVMLACDAMKRTAGAGAGSTSAGVASFTVATTADVSSLRSFPPLQKPNPATHH